MNTPLFRVLTPAAVLLSCGIASAASLRVDTLRTEYRTNPVVDVARPRLSWLLKSDERGQKQTAYQIVVASRSDLLNKPTGDLWDSGKVASDETAHIEYAGRGLQSRQDAWWKVRVWNHGGEPSAWSAPARWTTGLMQPSTEWKAQWIGFDELPPTLATQMSFASLKWVVPSQIDNTKPQPAGLSYYRTRFEVPAGQHIRKASISLSVDDQFVLFVNGEEAGRSNGRWNAWRKPEAIDVTARLRPGSNVLAIQAENTSVGTTGAIGRLIVEMENGAPLEVPVDASWRASITAAEGWHSPAFDDSAWPAVKELGVADSSPWRLLSGDNFVPPAAYLRKTFVADKPIRRAWVHATALGLYELSLNGKRVGNDFFTPGWTDYRKRLYYQSYEVTSLLRPGANAMGIIMGDGWATGHIGLGGRMRYGLQRPKVAAQMHIEYADGTQSTVLTDPSWKASFGPIAEQDLLDGEAYDATQEIAGWNTPEVATAANADVGWKKVNLLASWPAQLQAYSGVPVRRKMELKTQKVTQPTPGTWIFDLGQNMVGWARLRVRGPRGTKVRLRFAEVLNPDGTLYTRNLRGARATDFYTLRGDGIEEWEPRFTFHGFRYVELTGLEGQPLPDAVTGIVVHSDTPKTGTFVSSNEQVNQLQRNVEWSQRGNFLEIPMDCPQRDERAGWTGDAQVFVRNASYNMDVAAFFARWMVDVDDARINGAYTLIVPNVAPTHSPGIAGWADAGIIVPWTIYQMYGDKRILQRHYDAMAGYISWMEKNSKNFLRPAHGFGDWLSINADTPRDVVATAYFAYSTNLMHQTALALGKTEDAARFKVLFESIRSAFNTAYVGPDARIKGNTQTAYLLALHMDLLPEEKRAAAVQHLVDDIQAKDWHLSTGFIGVSYLNPVLSRFGRTDVAYRLLNQDTFPSWLFPVKNGATTIWERWDGWTPEKGFQDPNMNSFNHYSLGSVSQWLYDTVAGIAPDPQQPGWKHFLLRPQPGGGLTHASSTYDSIRGRIVSSWKQEGNKRTYNVTVPANTSTTVFVPATPTSKIMEGGRAVEQAAGVKLLSREKDAAVLEVQSGSYQFVVDQG
jgi:alpha-L-rhamnosidase